MSGGGFSWPTPGTTPYFEWPSHGSATSSPMVQTPGGIGGQAAGLVGSSINLIGGAALAVVGVRWAWRWFQRVTTGDGPVELGEGEAYAPWGRGRDGIDSAKDD